MENFFVTGAHLPRKSKENPGYSGQIFSPAEELSSETPFF